MELLRCAGRVAALDVGPCAGFDALAVSSKGAQGVMQLMPDTALEYGVRDPFSPQQSIDGGARYMRALLRRLFARA